MFNALKCLLRAGDIGHIPFRSSQVRTGLSTCCCPVSPLVEFLDQKCGGSDTGTRNCAWISERPRLHCKAINEYGVADVLDSLHDTESILPEAERIIDWTSIMRSGDWGSISGTRESTSYPVIMLNP